VGRGSDSHQIIESSTPGVQSSEYPNTFAFQRNQQHSEEDLLSSRHVSPSYGRGDAEFG